MTCQNPVSFPQESIATIMNETKSILNCTNSIRNHSFPSRNRLFPRRMMIIPTGICHILTGMEGILSGISCILTGIRCIPSGMSHRLSRNFMIPTGICSILSDNEGFQHEFVRFHQGMKRCKVVFSGFRLGNEEINMNTTNLLYSKLYPISYALCPIALYPIPLLPNSL